MKGYLLDTNVALSALREPEMLSPEVITALQSGPAWLSVVAYWEVTIKVQKGKLRVPHPADWWDEVLASLDGRVLAIESAHVARLWELPPIHRDPFDRMLVAQSLAEDLTLVTQDRLLQDYARVGCRVVG